MLPRLRASEPPLRSELLSVEQLARHAQALAAGHTIVTARGGNPLLPRLDENERILRDFNRATVAVDQTRQVTPAAEWLLDNFYLIEEQIQMARRHLPRNYSQELPRLLTGPSAGLPRVYDIVLELISHTDAQVDAGQLTSFVAAYQGVQLLKLGELWAIPIMLRLGLIENLQRITSRLAIARLDRNLADEWVDRLQDMAETNPSLLVTVVSDMAKSEVPLSSSFVAEFCARLSRQNPVLHLARNWLEQRLVEQGLSMDQLVHQESQNQAADQVSVSHSIGSLRFLSAMDWKEFVETLSLVDTTLRGDPADVYSDMDFATRDRYRHAVESLARHSDLTEVEIARCAIALADRSALEHGRTARSAHVGYYLIDRGQSQLASIAGIRWPGRAWVERAIHRFPLALYTGGIAALSAGATYALWHYARGHELRGWPLVAFTAVVLFCASQVAVAVINWISTLLLQPRLMPRLDFSEGIASDCRTMVVIPTMLGSADGVDRLIESLEIHYLANRDPLLHFALLTDLRDSTAETMPGDEFLVARVAAGVEMLNAKYPDDQHTHFYLFHRPRRWNPSEGVWMGYERKRGKLTEFNALLRGGPRGRFSTIVGQTDILPAVKFVITLDTDTQLPRDAARELVGTLAHPLNRPVFDPVSGIVTAGYGILQPRVGVSLPGAGRSRFARLFAGDAGIDPYTRTVSDVYQDVFHEGSFIGKGIYDVDAFERAVGGRFPENTVLSHDLLEAVHARSGLINDLKLYEEYPSRYNVDIGRRHRWIRGDWQIAQWLLPRVPGPEAHAIANPLSGLSRWKIFDNLRRSLVPVAQMILLLGSWLGSGPLAGLGPLVVLTTVALPGLLPAAIAFFRRPDDLPWSLHLRATAGTCGRQVCQIFLALAFLPYDAYISLDAIGRTLFRLLVTRRRLLEWQTSSDAEQSSRSDLTSFYLAMWIAPAVAIATGVLLFRIHPEHVAFAAPLLALWTVAPWMAWWISRPIVAAPPDLSAEQQRFLQHTARKTWNFFETFVTAQENWLPPDNFQEVPAPTIAARTSPTNLGLALLANLAARDFGYLSLGGLIERTRNAFTTMLRLERHRGHFYNWYDTRTLSPLQPLYISSVDSGNLAGHLLTLGSGLREQMDATIFDARIFSGLRDTVGVARTFAPDNADLIRLEDELSDVPATLSAAYDRLERAILQLAELPSRLSADEGELQRWVRVLTQNCTEQRADLIFLAPWLRDRAHRDQARSGADPIPDQIDRLPTLRELAQLEPGTELLREAGDHARDYLRALEVLARQADDLATMDFTFLFDAARNLFSIGYNVGEHRRDASYYDLLASEARLCSYVTVAQGQVPQDHWFSLGRLLVASGGEPILISWSGSMFEYLMPQLVMPSYEGTLLDHTCRAAVRQQIGYGAARGVPWGISESGYNRTDVHLNYQYRAFGVPGLGLKRGLAEDLVIAPYATAMALMVAPEAACQNLQRLAAEGRDGAYGFYEAIDYTPSRLPPDETSAVIRSYMAHHQGMSLLALVYLLRDQPMQRRFSACPLLKAADLLLQERVPKTAANVFADDLELEESGRRSVDPKGIMRVFANPSARAPEVHLLSNGRYHVVVSSAGGGSSRWHDLAVTRWREDATRDSWGTFVYLRDTSSGEVWSAAHQPTLRPTKGYEAIFTEGRAEFRQRHAEIETHTQISVSPEDDVELRRVTLVNRSTSNRVIELTSYAEVVLAPAAADAAHPAFSNLFVQTEFIPVSSAILCTRRARSQEEKPPWLLHLLLAHGENGDISCETDRARFVGRNGSLVRPAALQPGAALSNTAGSVLDPVVALRRTVTLMPNVSVVVDLVIGATGSREHALALVEKYQNSRMGDRAFELAWTHSQVTLRHLNATESEAQLFGRLAGALLYADPARRASSSALRTNRRGQNGLWSYGISGDAPLVLLRISDTKNIELVRQLIKGHSYWRMKGLTVELVIVNEDVSVYRQSLHDDITSLISSGIEAQMLDQPGGIFVRRLEQIPNDDRVLLQSVARILLDDANGTLNEQLEQRSVPETPIPFLVPSRSYLAEAPRPAQQRDLIYQNGFGGFTRDGREYVITLQPGQVTPAPWVNVLANPHFGTVVSESGGAYTWVENAHEFRLTPWNNDPVQDATGEAFYLRDENTGQYWSPTPSPARGATPYVIRHGFGYTVFEHTEFGITSEVWVYVAIDAPVKFTVVKLRNGSGRPRKITVTGYWEFVLGDLRHKTLLHVQTEIDLKTGALTARNAYNTEFPDRIAFIDVTDATRTLTGDRKEFIGRNGSLAQPAAMKRTRLGGKVGAGLDPCGAMQVTCDLADGQEREVTFRLGAGRNPGDVNALVQRFRRTDAGQRALEGVWAHWNRVLGAVSVDTPDPAVNIMANGWLLYQTLSCRIWARTGFYQSGGAYGFRDQLQDVMALVHAEPTLTREQILRAAARQFRDGDVQHWWHPPAGRGVRTHFSDDFLWLPYVTCRYVNAVADTGVLDEKIPFLEGRAVLPDEEAYYDLPHRSDETATLYQHCVRAIERGLRFGEHGLPLIGCGDWNDGLNRVGNEGRGESVWLAFFLYDVLQQFAGVARSRQDHAFAERCVSQAQQLQQAIEQQAWDGAWYRRAYFDDGTPLGSASNPECQIDSLPQSWSVISGAGEPARSRAAMQAVDQRLVRRDAGLIQLFDPPFDTSSLNPGYIKGYIPGVRENGGQYTHGAIWTVMAHAILGETERAWDLFNLLNPIHHGGTPAQIATYKVEPYVVAADVYGVAPHVGRGGWTWYTGSAGWMYRLLVETLLGLHREGESIKLVPRLPQGWSTYTLHYRHRQSMYHITIVRGATDSPDGLKLSVDGSAVEGSRFALSDDGREHTVIATVR
ncbi:GH36-type glycosyl hydrolase domain-containing protein [Horticoccus sp. 23ND18S-11]|uniref:GH36-type glycosyl hydrolase domain-containing protein n=1 Tax=Horticoccus sp. 23ND18S-11 TaxID=3391832 RepID=UPI0039C999FB